MTSSTPWLGEVLDAIEPAIGLLDQRGRLLRANRTLLETTGAAAAAVEGLPFWSIPWPALSRQQRQRLKQAVGRAAKGQVVKEELDLDGGDQSARSLEITVRPLPGETAPVQLIVVEGRDATAYKQTIRALHESEARFKTVFEAAGIGIVLKGLDGTMLASNAFFQTMLGYSAAELAGRDYLSITYPGDRLESRRQFRDLVAGKRSSYTLEKRYLHKDSQIVWGRITTSVVRGVTPNAPFVIGMVENISAQKTAEADLAELRRRLMQGREMEARRIAQDLHDGPLQEIIALSYQVQEVAGAPPGDVGHEQLHAIETALQDLARSLRTLCGELRPPTLAPFGLQRTIQSHAEAFRAAHPELTVTLDLTRDGQRLPEEERTILFRIYQEALNNVVRHSKANAVMVRFRLGGRRALLEVQDNGAGFDLPSHWIDLARQGHLGLVGAMERARDIGGRMRIKTAPGQGTLIQAVVPIGAADAVNARL